MRIGFFSEVPTFNRCLPNGVSAFIEAVSRELALHLGHEVHIFEQTQYFGQKKERKIADNLIIHRLFSLPLSKYQGLRIPLPFKSVFFGVDMKFDIIHAHGPMNGILATILGRMQNCTKVITYHTPGEQYVEYIPKMIMPVGGSYFIQWAEKLVYNSFDLMLTPAEKWRQNLIARGYKANRIFVLPNCVNIAENQMRINDQRIQSLREKYKLNGKKVVIYVGRMSPEKCIPDIIKLVPKIVKEEPDTHFLLVGKGPYLDKYRNLAQKIAPQNITFTGFISDEDLSNVMQMSNLGILFADGAQVFDITLLNYWSNHLPAIARKAGGMSDVISHNKNGILFQTNSEAYSYIISLLQDDKLAKKLGHAGYETVKSKYSVEAVTQQLLGYYSLAARKFHRNDESILSFIYRYMKFWNKKPYNLQ
jgi:glycosyltransferase involved in cell wall biosynthesis